MKGQRNLRRGRTERGAVAVFTAMLATVILIVAALAVDLGNTWARRGQLQAQADRAAVFGAQYLPARSPDEQLRVARAVAYYFVCNEVPGQDELNPAQPTCPDGPSSSTLDPYARALLTNGMVDLSEPNHVTVRTPQARVDFGFAGAADAEGVDQQKQATAKVMSPGLLAPMALSLDCMLNAGAAALGGTPVPFGYISTTHKEPESTTEPTTWAVTTQNEPKMSGVTPGRVPQQVEAGETPLVQVSGSEWPELAVNERYVVVFGKGAAPKPEVVGTLTLDGGRNPRRLGSIEVRLPSSVVSSPGEWQVKVAIENTTTGARVYSRETSYLNVDALIDDTGDISCGRLLRSPRGGTQANLNFVLNLQQGIDHLITTDPDSVSAGSLTLADLELMLQSGITECSGTDVTDTNGLQEGQVPYCVVTNMSNAYEAGFTEGMIGADGRLTCNAAHPCADGRSFTIPGHAQTLNDDHFVDFVKEPGLLTHPTFFSADAYLTPGTPVLTPESNLEREIYDSHRFMWVMVISTVGANSAVEAGDYPVLTFRPIFVTQRDVLEDPDPLPLLDASLLPSPWTLTTALAQVDASMVPAYTDEHGLLMDGSDLMALRFMTITPEALPAVPEDYSGPLSEYLGVGPKVVRLVQ